jgi:antitoxin component of MazEF toxin-antitoxin module
MLAKVCSAAVNGAGNAVEPGRPADYNGIMQARIERIGDGFGLRIPRSLLEACGLGGEVSLTVRDKTLVVAPAPAPARTGWEEAIQAIPQEMLDRDYEELRDFREMADEWDEKGWQWPEDQHRKTV